VNLSEVDIRLMGTRTAGNHAPVNNRKVQLRGKQVVYTAFYCSGINKAVEPLDSRYWPFSVCWLCRIERGIKSDVNN